MPLNLATVALYHILQKHECVHAAWFDDPENPSSITILIDQDEPVPYFTVPDVLGNLELNFIAHPAFKILRLPSDVVTPLNHHQQCQDEPIDLGTQIQPANANWLGTAGAPVKYLDDDYNPRWGILSNWHVMADGQEARGRAIYQPAVDYPECAELDTWLPVEPGKPCRIDAAIADTFLNGFHTVSDQILGIGTVGDHSIDAAVGLQVAKSGRTTAVTHGRCIAVGAAVKVGYGAFEASFVDQDLFEPTNGPFSAPGDSGSLIVGAACRCPCSLLFAGNQQLTVGNPIRFVNEALDLIYPFP